MRLLYIIAASQEGNLIKQIKAPILLEAVWAKGKMWEPQLILEGQDNPTIKIDMPVPALVHSVS